MKINWNLSFSRLLLSNVFFMYDYGKVVGSYDYESIESNSTSATRGHRNSEFVK